MYTIMQGTTQDNVGPEPIVDKAVDNQTHEYDWNDNITKAANDMREDCKRHKTLHMQTAITASTRFTTFMIANMVLGPTSGLLSAISLSLFPNGNSYITITLLFLSFVSGILASITKFSKYDEKSSTHKIASIKYSTLEGSIRRQLALASHHRVKASEYLPWIDTKLESLASTSPLLSGKLVMQSYGDADNSFDGKAEAPSMELADPTQRDLQTFDKMMLYEIGRLRR